MREDRRVKGRFLRLASIWPYIRCHGDALSIPGTNQDLLGVPKACKKKKERGGSVVDRMSVFVKCFGQDLFIFCWLWLDMERNKEQTNTDMVFFCMAGEQCHTIRLYPRCWQEHLPAPPVLKRPPPSSSIFPSFHPSLFLFLIQCCSVWF